MFSSNIFPTFNSLWTLLSTFAEHYIYFFMPTMGPWASELDPWAMKKVAWSDESRFLTLSEWPGACSSLTWGTVPPMCGFAGGESRWQICSSCHSLTMRISLGIPTWLKRRTSSRVIIDPGKPCKSRYSHTYINTPLSLLFSGFFHRLMARFMLIFLYLSNVAINVKS